MRLFLSFWLVAGLASSAFGQADALKVGPDHKLKPPNDAPTFFGNNPYVWSADGPMDGFHLVGGHTEMFAGVPARLTIQNYNSEHGLFVHITGTGGIGIISQSDSGAAAGKFEQTQHFDFPTLYVWRSGMTTPSDSPLINLKSWGTVDLIQAAMPSTNQTIMDANGAMHPPHIADSVAQADSTYFSTTQGKLCFKDSSGVIHPLY